MADKAESVNEPARQRTNSGSTAAGSDTKLEDQLYELVGTEEYVAPEVIKGLKPTRAVDLWSIGVIIY